MDSKIQETQNKPEFLRLLAAQRQLYSEAKRWTSFRFWISLALALFPVAAIFFSLKEAEIWVAVAGAVVAIIFPFVLEKLEKEKVEKASTVQEQFDTDLFGISWNKSLAGAKIPPEDIIAADLRFSGKRDKLPNWYSLPANCPHEKAVQICQRSNLVWDATQRRRFAVFLGVLGAIAYLFPFIWALYKDLPMRDYVLKFFFPTLPLVLLAIKNFQTHRRVAREQLEKAQEIKDLLDSGAAPSPETLRNNQDTILKSRREQLSVPDWVYDNLRPLLEKITRETNQNL